MPKSTSPDLALRKKMRKGTHSCFECRRRKIRCIFPPDNPDVCSECFARGSRCIDQEHANPDVIVDHRKNLRERVSRLEALVDTLLDDRTEKGNAEPSRTPSVAMRSETFPPTPLSSGASSSVQGAHGQSSVERGNNVPLLSIFEDALNKIEYEYAPSEASAPYMGSNRDAASTPGGPSGERFTITCKNTDSIDDPSSAASQLKRERATKGLLQVLPPRDQLTRILNSNNVWWETWRRKCSGTAGNVTLPEFAAQAYADGNIGHLGTLVLAVGICSEDNDIIDRCIAAVDQWVLSDDEYAAMLEGMECLILKAKWYADVGQPRRAWLAYRKGIMYAQLMGLHRKRTSSAPHESIWWSLYHGDRFLSLLLGLPYGINDAHCDLTLPATGKYLAPLVFMNKMSILAGKVIDRNQGMGEQTISWALQMDQEMEDLWSKLDPNWIDFTPLLVDSQANAAELRERLMGQMVYHQIRVYLHLPFMLKSAQNPRFSYSRTACLNGSREVLRLYQCLRTGTDEPLYECKAVDFLGFTAAVVVMLGLLNYGVQMPPMANSNQEKEKDLRLIEICIDMFRRASSEKGGKVAEQSAEVLDKMSQKLRDPEPKCGVDDQGPPSEFVIPYFGTISIRRGGQPSDAYKPSKPASKPSPSSNSTGSTQYTPSTDTTDNMFSQAQNFGSVNDHSFNFNTDPFVSYDGFYLNNTNIDTDINQEGLNNFPLPANNFSWQNVPMDIDQDWSWFLNDHQANANAQPQTLAIDNQFVSQNYMGF